jgi:hypothetical protein
MDPVGALIGAVLLGMGVVVLFGAVRNKKVWGTGGIIPTALTTGTIADLDKIPSAFEAAITIPTPSPTLDLEGAETGVLSGIIDIQGAIARIAEVDPALAANIAAQVTAANKDSSRLELMPLAQLLALADAKGRKAEADKLRLHIKRLTNESI